MTIYLGLGSNRGSRRENIARGIRELRRRGFRLENISPVVESPAMLPEGARSSWNLPYLNCVISGEADWTPEQGLDIAKEIEKRLGRTPSQRWSPRPLDIDLILWHDRIIETERLAVPHYGLSQRSFVLTPLLHIKADLVVPGRGRTIYEMCREVPPLPIWMAVLNITPDSFSDGGRRDDLSLLDGHVNSLIQNNVQIIDLGAESTRPNAEAVPPRLEWKRLQPVLSMLRDRLENETLRPLISVDSRHWQTLQRAIDNGADMVNDVTGLDDDNILSLVRENGCQAVAMHSVTVPADANVTLAVEPGVVTQLGQWLEKKIERWLDAGLDLNKVIFDPGVGFGKTALQSLELLSRCRDLRREGIRLLIGHSRKSFMNGFTDRSFGDRDLETLGISMKLCEQGVDIIRVHDAVMHRRAYLAWAHLNRRPR